MKKLISDYTFDASERKVTFSGYASIDLEGLLLITNVTDNKIIYNFADPSAGGGVSGNVVTLIYDTTTMSDTDALQIYYDDSNSTPASDENLVLLQEQNLLMRRLLKTTESLATTDVNQRQRVALDGGLGSSNAVPLNARILDSASQPIYNPYGNGFVTTNAPTYVVPDIWKFLDAARLNYQQCIRANLTF